MNESQDIEQKFKKVGVFELMKQMLTESQKMDYTQLIAIKNYFGEKVAFEYAFQTFYTCWLIYPAIGGIIVSLYQLYLYKGGFNEGTLYTFLYSALNSIWISIFIERWRRKQNELKLIFGTLVSSNVHVTDIRFEFQGNEQFNHENY